MRRRPLPLRSTLGDDAGLHRLAAPYWTRPNSPRQGLAIARGIIAARPRFYAGYRLQAFALGERHAAALKPLTRMVGLMPVSPMPWFFRAEMLMRLHRYGRAAADLSTALRFDRGYYRESIHLLRAECYRRLGRYDEALADCDRVSPDCWFAFFAGRLSLRKEQIVSAVARERAVSPSG
jgi:tetratricopeptide (TPR) repeat protein